MVLDRQDDDKNNHGGFENYFNNAAVYDIIWQRLKTIVIEKYQVNSRILKEEGEYKRQ